jgi:hypothetical protein
VKTRPLVRASIAEVIGTCILAPIVGAVAGSGVYQFAIRPGLPLGRLPDRQETA